MAEPEHSESAVCQGMSVAVMAMFTSEKGLQRGLTWELNRPIVMPAYEFIRPTVGVSKSSCISVRNLDLQCPAASGLFGR